MTRNLRDRIVQPRNNFVPASRTSKGSPLARRSGIRMPGSRWAAVSFHGFRYLAKGNAKRPRKRATEEEREREIQRGRGPRVVLVRGLPPSPTGEQGVAMGRSVGGIDLNSCFSQLFIRHSQPPRRRATATPATAREPAKATTYFNSSFPCEFLARTYDQTLLTIRGCGVLACTPSPSDSLTGSRSSIRLIAASVDRSL